MKLFSLSCTLVALLTSSFDTAFSSWDPQPTPFHSPSYIDLEFDRLDFSTHMITPKYTKRGLYHQLVSQYYTLPPLMDVDWRAFQKQNTVMVEKFIQDLKETCHHHSIEFDDKSWHSFKGHFSSAYDVYGTKLELERIKAFFSALLHDIKDPEKIKRLLELRRDAACLSFADESYKKDILDHIKAAKEDLTISYFVQYLDIVVCFETHEYEQALVEVNDLKQKIDKDIPLSHAWLKETLTYLVPRLHLILSQKNWDGYSNHEGKIDLTHLSKAEENFDLYLKNYPQGLYRDSVKNIKRRLLMLKRDTEKLSLEIQHRVNDLFLHTPLKSTLTDDFDHLVSELKLYFKGKIDFSQDHPLLIAFYFLYHDNLNAQDFENLQKNSDRFKDFPELLTYLQSQILYQLQRYQEVVDHTSAMTLTQDFLNKSTWALRAKAQNHLNHHEEALKLWQDLYTHDPEDMVAIEIYKTLIALNRPQEIFYHTYGIQNNMLLVSMCESAVTTSQLENLLTSNNVTPSVKSLIVPELLKRHLLSKHYEDFLKIWHLIEHQNFR